MPLCIVLLLCTLLLLSVALELNVTIASVPFAGSSDLSPDENMAISVESTEKYLASAHSNNQEMIIFPEGYFWWYLPTKELALAYADPFIPVINGMNTHTNTRINPCLDECDRNTIGRLTQLLSCISAKHNMHLVTNMATQVCEESSEDPSSCMLYNTEVVFDNAGFIQATYRKTHNYGATPPFDSPVKALYSPGSLNRLDTGDLSVFTVKGMTVGLLVCFDVEFINPMQALLSHNTDLDAVIVSMYWSNTPPLSWSILYQQSFSMLYPDITVIVANDGNNVQSWGSGAYHNGVVVSNDELFAIDDHRERTEGEGGNGEVYGPDGSGLITLQLPVMSTTRLGREKSRGGPIYDRSGDTAVNTHSGGGDSGSGSDRDESVPCSIAPYGLGRCAPIIIRIDGEEEKEKKEGVYTVQSHMNSLQCQAHLRSGTLVQSEGYADGYNASALSSSNVKDSLVLAALNSTLNVPGSKPLNILICSVVKCQQESEEEGEGEGEDDSRGEGYGEREEDTLQCANLYTSFSATDLVLEMHISPSAFNVYLDSQEMDDSHRAMRDSYQIMPLVGRADAHTLDASVWTYEKREESGANGTISVSGKQALGVVSLFAIKQ